jgi:hypothetical protein
MQRRVAATGESGKYGYGRNMRRLAPLTALLVAACATTPPPAPAPVSPTAPSVRQSGNLLGLTADDLVQRFGRPSFQVREGAGLKLQFAGPSCVLDAYLYRPASGSGVERVTHIDTRRPSGEDVAQAVCLAALAAR